MASVVSDGRPSATNYNTSEWTVARSLRCLADRLPSLRCPRVGGSCRASGRLERLLAEVPLSANEDTRQCDTWCLFCPHCGTPVSQCANCAQLMDATPALRLWLSRAQNNANECGSNETTVRRLALRVAAFGGDVARLVGDYAQNNDMLESFESSADVSSFLRADENDDDDDDDDGGGSGGGGGSGDEETRRGALLEQFVAERTSDADEATRLLHCRACGFVHGVGTRAAPIDSLHPVVANLTLGFVHDTARVQLAQLCAAPEAYLARAEQMHFGTWLPNVVTEPGDVPRPGGRVDDARSHSDARASLEPPASCKSVSRHTIALVRRFVDLRAHNAFPAHQLASLRALYSPDSARSRVLLDLVSHTLEQCSRLEHERAQLERQQTIVSRLAYVTRRASRYPFVSKSLPAFEKTRLRLFERRWHEHARPHLAVLVQVAREIRHLLRDALRDAGFVPSKRRKSVLCAGDETDQQPPSESLSLWGERTDDFHCVVDDYISARDSMCERPLAHGVTAREQVRPLERSRRSVAISLVASLDDRLSTKRSHHASRQASVVSLRNERLVLLCSLYRRLSFC